MDVNDKQRSYLEELEAAISHGDDQVVKALLDNAQLEQNTILSALPRAIESESAKIVEALISCGNIDPNHRGEGWPLLSYAVENGSPEVVKKLCELGADPNQIWDEVSGRRPLHLAVDLESTNQPDSELGNYDCDFTRALLEGGADPLLEDNKECHAIDEARGLRHRNAVQLMEKFVSDRPRELIGKLKTHGPFDQRISTGQAVVEVINSVSGADGSLLVMAAEADGRVVLKTAGTTAEETWILMPNLSAGAERPGYSLVNRATGLALEQPNPSDEILVGEAPQLRLKEMPHPIHSKNFLWSLRPVRHGDGEQLWAIQDHRHAYSIGGHLRADWPSIFFWAWAGSDEQCWMIRQR